MKAIKIDRAVEEMKDDIAALRRRMTYEIQNT
jgi:hypothetical protein